MTSKRRPASTAIARPLPPATAAQQEPVKPPYPVHLLHSAASTIMQRGKERDTSTTGQQQERSMAATVAAFNAIEGTALTERQGWAFMQTLKLVRAASTARNGRFNPDDYLDGAAYAALGGEAAKAQSGEGGAA